MVHLDIRQLREIAGVSQAQAARDLKMSRNTLAKWEAFPSEIPMGKLTRCLVYLGYDLEINLRKDCGSVRNGE